MRSVCGYGVRSSSSALAVSLISGRVGELERVWLSPAPPQGHSIVVEVGLALSHQVMVLTVGLGFMYPRVNFGEG